jgi:hypothetical protein
MSDPDREEESAPSAGDTESSRISTDRFYGRARETQETLSNLLSDTTSLKTALHRVEERRPNVRLMVETLNDKAAKVTGIVLNEVNDYVSNNEINLTASNHTVRIEGDDDGLDKIEAELTEALRDKDVTIEFNHDGGLTINLDDSAD